MGSRFAPSVSRSTPWFAPGYASRSGVLVSTNAASTSPGSRSTAAPLASHRASRRCIAAAVASSLASRSASSRVRHRPRGAHRRQQVGHQQRRPAVRRQLQQPRPEPADDLLVERRARARDQQPRARALPLVPGRGCRLEPEPPPQADARGPDGALGLVDRDVHQLLVLGHFLEQPLELGHVGRLVRPLAPALGDRAGRRRERRVEGGRRSGFEVAVERRPQRQHGLDLAGAGHDLNNLIGHLRSQLEGSRRVTTKKHVSPLGEVRRCVAHLSCSSRSSPSPSPGSP
jgi:hypothetical protein